MKLISTFVALTAVLTVSCKSEAKLKGGTATAKAAIKAPVPQEAPQVPEPGIPTKLVGVNFEDNPSKSGDNDFNDAVLCFDGAFVVDGAKVKSLKPQSVKPRFTSNAGCGLKLTARVKGSDKPLVYFNKAAKDAGKVKTDSSSGDLVFNKGDELIVTLEVVNGVCDKSKTFEMTDASHAKVEYDVCNESGR